MSEASRFDAKGIAAMLLMGLIAGWLASWILGGGGFFKYIIWGVLGSFVGSWLIPKTGFNINTGSAFWDQIITATIGAVVLVVIARIIA